MRVMGIDPGLTRTGYAVVEEVSGRPRALACGTIRAEGGRSVPEQLAALHAGLRAAIEQHRPDAVAVERLFMNANRRTATRVGQASGIALLAAAEGAVEIFEYSPSEVKRAVVGVGTASKDQIGYMVRAILGKDVRPDSADAADALALAICHLNGHRARAAVRAAGGRP